MKISEIAVGDIVEVTYAGWEGLQYKVDRITASGMLRGCVTTTIAKWAGAYPVGKKINFNSYDVKLIGQNNNKTVDKRSIFTKKGGWGP